MSGERLSVRVRVEGRVQGVSYRATTASRARELGVTGWVMNLDDGAVEVHIEGPEVEVQSLLSWCEEGPKRAQVQRLSWRKCPAERGTHFQVRT